MAAFCSVFATRSTEAKLPRLRRRARACGRVDAFLLQAEAASGCSAGGRSRDEGRVDQVKRIDVLVGSGSPLQSTRHGPCWNKVVLFFRIRMIPESLTEYGDPTIVGEYMVGPSTARGKEIYKSGPARLACVSHWLLVSGLC